MTKDAVADWDTTAANNTDLAGIGIGSNAMLVTNIDNFCREMMAQVAAFRDLTPALAAANSFTASQTVSASFARINVVGTDLTSGSRAFGIGGVADGTFAVLALNDNLTLKEELARFEPAGTSISDAQATVTREKGDARYGRINTKTSATETTFEVGQMLLCIMDSAPGAVPALNDTLGVRLDNSRYKVAGSTGTSLTGTWRVCGWLATGEANVGVMMQRVA